MNELVALTPFELKLAKDKYLELVASGEVESKALVLSGMKKSTYIRCLVDDENFAKLVETARKHRADHWVEKVAEGYDTHYDKDETPGAKLIFDKLTYLAKADNPERYGGSGKGVNVSVNLGEFKMLPPEEAKKALAADPFAIPTEFEIIPDDSGDLL
jgi:hypothetical protein